jgi:molecular chaperone GrpE
MYLDQAASAGRETLGVAVHPEVHQALVNQRAELAKENEQLREEERLLRDEGQQLRDALSRQKAEFENYRKRVLKEKDQIREATKEDIISRLLPVLDNFERAMQSASLVPEAASIRQGIEMVSAQLMGALASDGLEQVKALHAPFDPNMHDAIAVEERDDVAENTVVEVMLPGYRLGERLLRPAMVKVSKAPSAS